jgi:hypothetical protein
MAFAMYDLLWVKVKGKIVWQNYIYFAFTFFLFVFELFRDCIFLDNFLTP